MKRRPLSSCLSCLAVTPADKYRLMMPLFSVAGNGGELQWCFSQVKGTVEDDVTEGEPFFTCLNPVNVRLLLSCHQDVKMSKMAPACERATSS